MLLGLLSAAILVIADRLAKYLAVQNLKESDNITLINGVLGLTFLENPGAAFGILPGGRWVLICIPALMIAFIGFYYFKLHKNPVKYSAGIRAALVLIMAGAMGNLLDRLFNDGYVIDFFQFKFIEFPIFNTADIFVVTGSVLFAVITLLFDKDAHNETT